MKECFLDLSCQIWDGPFDFLVAEDLSVFQLLKLFLFLDKVKAFIFCNHKESFYN